MKPDTHLELLKLFGPTVWKLDVTVGDGRTFGVELATDKVTLAARVTGPLHWNNPLMVLSAKPNGKLDPELPTYWHVFTSMNEDARDATIGVDAKLLARLSKVQSHVQRKLEVLKRERLAALGKNLTPKQRAKDNEYLVMESRRTDVGAALRIRERFDPIMWSISPSHCSGDLMTEEAWCGAIMPWRL